MGFKLNSTRRLFSSIRVLLTLIALTFFIPSTLLAADTIKLGLNFTNSGMLKTQGEGTEVAVDIAVSEINASGGINGKKIELIKYRCLHLLYISLYYVLMKDLLKHNHLH